MEVVLPGNATFEFDDFRSRDHEAKASRFPSVRLEVVEGDPRSFGGIRRDNEPFGEEGSRRTTRKRNGVGRVHDKPGFVAPDDRAGVAGRNEGARFDFISEL